MNMVNNKIRSIKVFLAAAFMMGAMHIAQGHGLGLTFLKDAGDYSIDLDADVLALQANQSIRFSFSILSKNEAPPPEFTDAWVRIAPKDGFGTVFAGDLHNPEFGLTGMTFIFPQGGEYELSVRFQKDGEKVTEDVVFPLTVENDTNASQNGPLTRDLFIGLF